MLCKKYDSLTHLQKITMIGELVHSIQSDDAIFELGNEMIKLAFAKGIFDKVKIMPNAIEQNSEETSSNNLKTA